MKQREYIVTDQCAYQPEPPEGYNEDPKRKPHMVALVDTETGTLRYLSSGDRISLPVPKTP